MVNGAKAADWKFYLTIFIPELELRQLVAADKCDKLFQMNYFTLCLRVHLMKLI